MLSDVLFEAVCKIETYQHNFPRYYAPYKEGIEEVKRLMQELRKRLDKPPETNKAVGTK